MGLVVKPLDVLWLEAQRNYVRLHLAAGAKPLRYSPSSGYLAVLCDGSQLPVGRKYRPMVEEQLTHYAYSL